MKVPFLRVIRWISCVLLPIGTFSIIETIFLIPEVLFDRRPYSGLAITIMLLLAVVLFAAPFFIIWKTGPTQQPNGNWRLIFTLIGIGVIPIAYMFLILSAG